MPYPTGVTEKSGALSIVGVSKEETFGDPVAASSFLPMTGCTIEEDPGYFSPELMMGVRDLHVFPMYGEAKFTGTVEGPLFPSNAIEFLVAAIGTDTVSGTASPYHHVLAQANVLPSLTIEKNTGGYQSLQFAGCKVGKFSLKLAAGNEAASMSADVSGQSVEVLNSPTAISVTNELPFDFAEATASIFGTNRYETTNVEFSIDNGLKETYTFGGNHGPSFITPVTLAAMGSFDVVWDSYTDATYGDFTSMVNGTLGAFTVNLVHSVNTYTVTLTAEQVAFSKFSDDLKVSDVILSSVSWESSMSISDGYSIRATVLNGVSTGY